MIRSPAPRLGLGQELVHQSRRAEEQRVTSRDRSLLQGPDGVLSPNAVQGPPISMMFPTPTARQERDGAQTEKQAVERALCLGRATSAADGWLTFDLVGSLRVDCGSQQVWTAGTCSV